MLRPSNPSCCSRGAEIYRKKEWLAAIYNHMRPGRMIQLTASRDNRQYLRINAVYRRRASAVHYGRMNYTIRPTSNC